MTVATIEQYARRETRYTIHNDAVIAVRLQRAVEKGHETIDGRLLDLSPGGIKVSVPICLPFAEPVRLAVSSTELDLEIEVDAEVCWSRPSDDNKWLIGCTIIPKISSEILTKLALSTLIERRQFSRHRVDIQATANWELGDQTFSVQLNDLSAEGFCIQGSQSGGIGQRVLLKLTKRDGSLVSAAGKAKWQLKIDQEYLVGCELTNSSDYAKLREFAAIPDAKQREQDRTSALRPYLKRFALVMLLLAVIPCAWIGLGFARGDKKGSGGDEEKPIAVAAISDAPTTETPTIDTPITNVSIADTSIPNPRIVPTANVRRGHAGEAPGDINDKANPVEPRHDPTVAAALPDPEQAVDAGRAVDSKATSSASEPVENQSPFLADIHASSDDAIRAVEIPHISASENTADASRGTTDSSSQQTISEDTEPLAPWNLAEIGSALFSAITDATKPSPPVRQATPPSVDDPRPTAKLADRVPQERIPEKPSREVRPDGDVSGGSKNFPPVPVGVTDVAGAPTVQVEAWDDKQITAPSTKRPTPAPAQLDEAKVTLAVAAFVRGSRHYRAGRYQKALEEFTAASKNDSRNPLYFYLLAISQYQLDDLEGAERAVKLGAELETQRPVKNWGKVMSRYQGRSRLWLEQARAQARAAS